MQILMELNSNLINKKEFWLRRIEEILNLKLKMVFDKKNKIIYKMFIPQISQNNSDIDQSNLVQEKLIV